MFEWLATPRFSSDPMATTTHSSHTHTRRQKKRDMVVAALHECITQKPLSICRSPKSKTSVLALVSSSSSASATMSKVMDREKPTTYHVVSSGGGSLEVVPSMPRIEKRPYCCGYSSVSHERDSVLHIQRAYRVHFSVIDKTRSWSRGTKRSIRWVLGLTNLTALREGKVGRECRGQEHEVELSWSIKSGKRKVYWNKSNITNLFRQRDNDTLGKFDVSWKAGSGETLRIVAIADQRSPDIVKYELFIEGTNFFRLLCVGELGRLATQEVEEQRSQVDEAGSQRNLSFDSTDDPDTEVQLLSSNSLGFRLSIAGFNSMTCFDNEIKDELHSDLYSPVLDYLRCHITRCLPQTEEIVSRAIFNAFFVDSQSQESFSLSSFEETDPYQIEVDYVWEAYEWVKLNVEFVPLPDGEDLALRFLQKRIEDIFLRIRNKELSSNEAVRVVLSVAAVLGLRFATKMVQDTIILDGLEKGTTMEDLHRALSAYGEVEATSIARASRAFGFCRFVHESSIDGVAKAVDNDVPIMGSEQSVVIPIRGNLFDCQNPLNRLGSRDAGEQQLDDSTDDSSCAAVPPSHTFPHLMGPLGSDDYALFLESPDCVSQLSRHTLWSAMSAPAAKSLTANYQHPVEP